MSLHLITVATSSNGYFRQFVESCKRNDMNLTILGWGMEWKGFTWRLDLIREFLHSPTLRPDDMVCFIDAYDVLVLESSDELVKRFRSFDSDVVFMSEKNPFHTLIFGELCDGHAVNGGCVIGYVHRLKELFDLPTFRKVKQQTSDDQVLWSHVCQKSPFFQRYVKYDTEHTIMYVDPLQFPFPKTSCEFMPAKRPVFYHCSGNRTMEAILEQNGYDTTSESVAVPLWKRVVYYTKLGFQTNKKYIFTILGLILLFLLLKSCFMRHKKRHP